MSMQNRQNGRRRRGSGNNPRPMGQAMGGQGNASRLEVRVRGNANQLLDKYKVLARDAHQAGDRVAAEYYLQHADHYFRVLNDGRIRQEEMRTRRSAFDQLDDDHDQDQDEDGEEGDRDQDMRHDRGDRSDRNDRSDHGRGGEQGERAERGRDRGNRPPRPTEERKARDDRRDQDGDRPRRERNDRAQGGIAAEPQAMSDGEAALAAFGGTAGAEEMAAPPVAKRRGRPRKVVTDTPKVSADGSDPAPATDI